MRQSPSLISQGGYSIYQRIYIFANRLPFFIHRILLAYVRTGYPREAKFLPENVGSPRIIATPFGTYSGLQFNSESFRSHLPAAHVSVSRQALHIKSLKQSSPTIMVGDICIYEVKYPSTLYRRVQCFAIYLVYRKIDFLHMRINLIFLNFLFQQIPLPVFHLHIFHDLAVIDGVCCAADDTDHRQSLDKL